PISPDCRLAAGHERAELRLSFSGRRAAGIGSHSRRPRPAARLPGGGCGRNLTTEPPQSRQEAPACPGLERRRRTAGADAAKRSAAEQLRQPPPPPAFERCSTRTIPL